MNLLKNLTTVFKCRGYISYSMCCYFNTEHNIEIKSCFLITNNFIVDLRKAQIENKITSDRYILHILPFEKIATLGYKNNNYIFTNSFSIRFKDLNTLLTIIEHIEHKMNYPSFYDFKLIKSIYNGNRYNVNIGTLNNKKYALKKIRISTNKHFKNALNEIYIHKKIYKNEFCVKLENVTKYGTTVVLGLEYINRGDLFEYFTNNNKNITLDSKLDILYQVVLSIEHLEKVNNVLHRDLKLENILINEHNQIFLADFGLSTILKPNDRAYSITGTFGYMSPELFHIHGYSYSINFWQLGCIIYLIAYLHPPFFFGSENWKEYQRKINKDSYVLRGSIFDDLIKQLMTHDLQKRIKCWKTVKRHSIFDNVEKSIKNRVVYDTNVDVHYPTNLSKFEDYDKSLIGIEYLS